MTNPGEILDSAVVSSTDEKCAKCGCEMDGETALVGGKIWCHPCADKADVPCLKQSEKMP
jgi:formylmethanofuran dehydrogenase subunit E